MTFSQEKVNRFILVDFDAKFDEGLILSKTLEVQNENIIHFNLKRANNVGVQFSTIKTHYKISPETEDFIEIENLPFEHLKEYLNRFPLYNIFIIERSDQKLISMYLVTNITTTIVND